MTVEIKSFLARFGYSSVKIRLKMNREGSEQGKKIKKI